jgi:hypothetical protein
VIQTFRASFDAGWPVAPNAWMRMYLPKHSAEPPSFTCLPATKQLGASTFVKVNCLDAETFAFFCAVAIFCCAA